VGIGGKDYYIIKTDSSTNAVTIDPNAAETVGGNASRKASTIGHKIHIISNNVNWEIVGEDRDTDWISYTPSISAETTDPTKATTTIVDHGHWRRVGDSMEIRITYYHTDATGAAAGTGTYFFDHQESHPWVVPVYVPSDPRSR